MPTQVNRDDPELQGEQAFLRGPHSPVQGKGMEKNDGETSSLVAVADCDVVDLGVHAFLSRRCS
jgi:hypothetical protein